MRIQGREFNTFLKYFYLFWIIIYAGSATVFARSLGDIRTVGNAFALLLTGLVIGQNRVRFSKKFLLSLAVFSLFAAVTFVKNHRISPIWWSQWIIWLTIAYCLCQIFGKKLFESYEKIIAILCIASIPFWISMIISRDATIEFVKMLSFSKPFSANCNVAANMIVYTVPPLDFLDNEYKFVQRNYGFAWEPGAFASYICLALFCNILRTDLKLKGNWSLLVLSFTLLTTQSTTGYIVAILMVALWLILKKRIVPFILLVPVLVLAFNLPFVREKLFEEFAETQSLDISNAASDNGLGRLFSFKLDFEEFLRHPLIGLGGYSDGTWLHEKGYDDLVTISGIGKLLSMFGAIMTLVFLALTVKSGDALSKLFRGKNGYILIVVLIGIMISYGIWTQPIFIAFWMFSVYMPATISSAVVNNRFIIKNI